MQKIMEKNSLSSPKPTFFVFFIHIIRNSLHHFPPQNLSHPSSYFILSKFLFISSLYMNLFSKLVENHLKIDRKRIIQKETSSSPKLAFLTFLTFLPVFVTPKILLHLIYFFIYKLTSPTFTKFKYIKKTTFLCTYLLHFTLFKFLL